MVHLAGDHEGHAVQLRGTGVTWEGNHEIETRRFICSCGVLINVETRADVGPPPGSLRDP